MFISISFSAFIYKGATFELNRIEKMQRVRRPVPAMPGIDPEIIEETKNRITLSLTLINLLILGVSGTAGYFLAGKTLEPISQILDDQKKFVSDASHELRTPLTSMKTEIEVALRDKKLNLRNSRALLSSNLEEVNKMQKLSNYLLTLNRYQDNRNVLEFKKTDLKNIVEKVVKRFSTQIKEKNITIQLKLKKTEIQANENALEELCSILLDNAIKYSNKGGKVIIKTDKKTHAILEVVDFGVGIQKSEIPHIFNRFYRADSSRNKQNTDGYGLGLAIAKNIVDTHKGKIEVTSKPNYGSTFKIVI